MSSLPPDPVYDDELFHAVARDAQHGDIDFKTLCGRDAEKRVWDWPEYFVKGLFSRKTCPECMEHPDIALYFLAEAGESTTKMLFYGAPILFAPKKPVVLINVGDLGDD